MGIGRVLMSRCSSSSLFVGGGGGQLIINSKNFGASDVAIGFQNRIFYSSGASDVQNPPPNADQTHQKLSNKRGFCLGVKRLSEKAIMPSGASASSVGYDLFSARDTKVPARDKALVPTDLRIAVEEGLSAHILPHLGTLAREHAIDVGSMIINYFYRGRVYVHLFNHSDVDYEVKAGDNIAQLLVVYRKGGCPAVVEVEDWD